MDPVQGFIVVRNWEKFQHYKNRDPKWIKLYTRLHRDDAFLALTGHQRAVLVGIWLEYAICGKPIPTCTRDLSRRLALRVTTPDLVALNHAGFIDFLLAPCYQQEIERERSRSSSSRNSGKPGPLAADVAAILEDAGRTR